MDFLLSMSIFTSAADVSREGGKAREWMRAWVATGEDKKGGAAAPPQPPEETRRIKSKQAAPWFAPEFDGLNCFETFVSH